MRIDFKDTYARWVNGSPDELHVEAKTTQVSDLLTRSIGKMVMSKGHSVTRYHVLRKVAGTFILTSARGEPR